MNNEVLIPSVAVITDVRTDTPDVKTFRVLTPDGKKPFEHMPGQCAMLSIPGVGEALFSITSSPTNREYMEFSIKKCGCLTSWIHMLEPGQQITIRGPYGKLQIIYGSRSKDDLVDYQEIIDEWMKAENVEVNLTIDREQEGWDGHVGFVPNYVKELSPDLGMTVLMCGPPIMIKFSLAGLKELGFTDTQVYTTMELRMKCGIGKCGRCNIGNKYVCKDGPVFRFDELGELPDEY